MQIADPYLRRVAEIESGMNPMARNPRSSAKGLFQFIDSTAREYGLDDPFEPQASLIAAQQLTERNRTALRRALGREPTPQELYLAHQQGAGGAAKLLTNPNAPLTDVIGMDAANLNAGNPNMTAGQFAQQWTKKFGEIEQESPQEEFIPIETPDGIVEFPASMSIEEIEAVLQAQYPQEQPATAEPSIQQTPQKPSFLARMGRDVAKRSNQALASLQRDQSLPEDVFQIAGQAGLGLVGDTIGNVIQSGVNYSPDIVKEGGRSAMFLLGKLPSFGGGTIGERVPGEVARLNEQYGEFAKENPRTAANIEAGLNLGTMFLGPTKATGAGRKVSEVGERVGRVGSPKIITTDDLAAQSRKAYQKTESVGGLLPPQAADDFLDDVMKRITPKTQEAKIAFPNKAAEIDDTIIDMMDLSGKPLSLQGVEEIDKMLTQKKMQNFNPATGGYNEVGNAYREIQDALRDTVEQAIAKKNVVGGEEGFQALKKASKLWSQRIKLQNIEDIVQRANMTEQPTTSIRSGLRTLLNNKKKIKSYTKAEREAIQKAAEKSTATELLNMFGSRLPSIIATGGGDTITGGALRLGSIAAREGANANQLRKIGDLGQMIAYGGKPPSPSALSLIAKPTGSTIQIGGAALGTLDNKALQRLMQIEAMNQFLGEQE